MKKVFGYFVSLAVVFGLTGCGGGAAVPQHEAQMEQMPEWYTNPPNNNPIYLYGLGEGMTNDQAVKNALDSLASRLSVTVQSSYEVNTKIQKGFAESFSQSSQRNLKSEVAKIRISNYEIDKSQQLAPGHYAVLVRSDKDKFVESLIKEMDVKLKAIDDKTAANKDANIIKKTYTYKDAITETEGFMPTLLVLSTLDEKFDDAKYFGAIQKLNNEYEALQKAINFVISIDGESKNMAETIRVALTNNGFKVVGPAAKNANTVLVKLTTRSEQSEAMGFIVAKMTTNIELTTADGKVVGGNKLNISGQSPQSYELAKENGAKKLSKMIEKEGMSKILGLKL